MECKHGTHGPCDLCAEEDAEHDRDMSIQARIDAAVAAERERCAELCDAMAQDRLNSRDERYMAAELAAQIRA